MGVLGKKFWEKSLLWGGQVFVGMNDSPFVGEVVKLVEGVVQGAVQGCMLWMTVLRGRW